MKMKGMKRVNVSVIGYLAVVLAILGVACTQQEGIGGSSHIKGKIQVSFYNSDFTLLLSEKPVPAADEDVFLLFGNDSVIGDDVTTSNTGNFEFNYLWPGNYKLVYYCDDTTGLTNEKVAIVKEITLRKNETLELNDLIIKRKLKWNEGNSFVTGKIMINYYNDDFSLLLSEEPARDEDVFLMFGNNTSVSDDTKTSMSGNFQFSYLWPGNYTLFYYSEDTTGISPEGIAIVNEFTLQQNQTVEFDNLIIKKSLEWDEGTSSIKGTVYVVNYLNSSTYPNLVPKDITPAQEQEIYMTYGNHPFYDERIRTSRDGSFMFQNLIKGKYKIFVYSEDKAGGTEMEVIEKEIEITEDNTQYLITDIIYINKL
jgi:hypothetical protein